MPNPARTKRREELRQANLRPEDPGPKNAPSRMPSSLEQLVPKNWNAEELEQLREAAWKNQGVAMLSLQDVDDEFERQFLTNMASKRFGKRVKN